jgi:hypothetical protein
MLDLHCPASRYRCGYNGDFLVCSILVHPLEVLLVDCAWRGLGKGKWPGQREAALAGGKSGGTDLLKFRLLFWYTPLKWIWNSVCGGDTKLLLSKYMGILLWQDHYMTCKYLSLYWSISIVLIPLTCLPLLSSHPFTSFSLLSYYWLTFLSQLPCHTHHPHMIFCFSALLSHWHPHFLLTSHPPTFLSAQPDLSFFDSLSFRFSASVFSMHDLSLPHFYGPLLPRLLPCFLGGFDFLSFYPPASKSATEDLSLLCLWITQPAKLVPILHFLWCLSPRFIMSLSSN